MPPRPPRDSHLLELTPVGDHAWAAVPVEVRLRRLLRAAARSYGLRALRLQVRPKRRRKRSADA